MCSFQFRFHVSLLINLRRLPLNILTQAADAGLVALGGPFLAIRCLNGLYAAETVPAIHAAYGPKVLDVKDVDKYLISGESG